MPPESNSDRAVRLRKATHRAFSEFSARLSFERSVSTTTLLTACSLRSFMQWSEWRPYFFSDGRKINFAQFLHFYSSLTTVRHRRCQQAVAEWLYIWRRSVQLTHVTVHLTQIGAVKARDFAPAFATFIVRFGLNSTLDICTLCWVA